MPTQAATDVCGLLGRATVRSCVDSACPAAGRLLCRTQSPRERTVCSSVALSAPFSLDLVLDWRRRLSSIRDSDVVLAPLLAAGRRCSSDSGAAVNCHLAGPGRAGSSGPGLAGADHRPRLWSHHLCCRPADRSGSRPNPCLRLTGSLLLLWRGAFVW